MSHIPITNTSPLLYLYRIGVIDWLPELFDQVWTPQAVRDELWEGQRRGYQVPRIEEYSWLQVIEPVQIPSEWLSLDLGKGELAYLETQMGPGGQVPPPPTPADKLKDELLVMINAIRVNSPHKPGNPPKPK